ncbi:MAG: zinc ribbon domain-containing protein [candidate division KSB1 bacterium]|nr:zinc ribbon domain-containing protein [candidate division KSB1 bacterium]MDZ7295349.1 zinc ribbon domain-containing protein [candidate division KSB1 bacterium]MDZ7338544.1 zinc ribbon domain-containing protein [candidate division KSB1 bacterium]MDZ7386573.1 zinc ribbon domain-containing protein [candidate division KSB1 bacterium]MDZ7393586.1 zinc ribbon domain-containing protein [candidate division KSB1 bacterium]
MPTYEYRCTQCEHMFEVFQSIKDEPVKTCPMCGGAVRRLIGGGNGLIFKGSGFYITDYRNKGRSSGKDDSGKKGSSGGGESD